MSPGAESDAHGIAKLRSAGRSTPYSVHSVAEPETGADLIDASADLERTGYGLREIDLYAGILPAYKIPMV